MAGSPTGSRLPAMGGILLGYAGILWLCRGAGPALCPLLTGGWLVLGVALALRGRVPPLALTRGGRSSWGTWVAAALLASLVLAAGLGLLGGARLLRSDPLLPALLVAMWVPIGEELFFRGLLLQAIRERAGPVVAVAGSAGAFGLLHLPQGHGLAMAAMGIVLGVVTLSTRSLLPPILLHAGWNALALTWRLEPAAGRLELAVVSSLFLVAVATRAWYTRTEEAP